MADKKKAAAATHKEMTPSQLMTFLDEIVKNRIMTPIMIWGPPGIGKSQIVQQVLAKHNLKMSDIRLSQLAPLDVRGLPDKESRQWTNLDGTKVEGFVTANHPPAYLPRSDDTAVFWDEINMAPPLMMGLAQQILLDRRLGDYTMPIGCFQWAAGNRKEDGAAVNSMPSPVANRMIHVTLLPNFDDFQAYAIRKEMHEHMVAFLAFRPALLHSRPDNLQQVAWPSPRSWEVASNMMKAGIDPEGAIGAGAAGELAAFRKVYGKIPDVTKVLAGEKLAFPSEASEIYAVITALITRIKNGTELIYAYNWVDGTTEAGKGGGGKRLEWVTMMLNTLINVDREKFQALSQDPALTRDTDFTTRLSTALRKTRNVA